MGYLPKKTCPHCSKRYSNKGVYEHMRFHCKSNKRKEKKSYSKRWCPICDKMYHEQYINTHKFVAHNIKTKRARNKSRQKRAEGT